MTSIVSDLTTRQSKDNQNVAGPWKRFSIRDPRGNSRKLQLWGV